MSTPAPQPGPPRPGGRLLLASPPVDTDLDRHPDTGLTSGLTPGTAVPLQDLPVAEHVAVLAAEHDRLHRLLATIDQL